MNVSPALAEAVFSTRSDAIIAADRQGTIQFWNPGAERIFGCASGDAIGQSLDIIIPERLRQRHWEGYRCVVGSGETATVMATSSLFPGSEWTALWFRSNSRSCRCATQPAS